MKQNLGSIDRILRFILGIWIIQLLLPSISQPLLWWVMMIIGVIALVESFIGYCWIHSALKLGAK